MPDAGPGHIAKLVTLILSAGLAWSMTLALTVWLLGILLSGGQ